MAEERYSIECDPGFDFRSSAYRELFEKTDSSPFCAPDWLHYFYQTLAVAQEAEPLIILIREKGLLAGLLPFVRRKYGPFRVIEFADLGVSDYSALVLKGDLDLGEIRPLRRQLVPFDFISIRKIRESDLPGFRLLGNCTIVKSPFRAHSTPLHAPASEWKARLSPPFVKFMHRKNRLLSRDAEVSFRELKEESEIRAAFRSMIAFRKPRFEKMKQTDPLQDSATAEFYMNIAIDGAKRGFAATYVMSAAETPIAVVFGLEFRSTFSFLLLGFDFDQYRNYSLGLLVIEAVIHARIDEGDTAFDFMIGEQAYKQDFGTTPTQLYSAWTGNGPWKSFVAGMIARSGALQRTAKRLASRI